MRNKPQPVNEYRVEQLQAFQDAVAKEGDLPCVLIAVAMLEKALSTLIHSHLIECQTTDNLFKNDVLDSFSKLYRVAYSLGFISKKTLHNLERIGKIRNAFAHSPEMLSFKTHAIKDVCDKLEWPPVVDSLDAKARRLVCGNTSNRNRFLVTCAWTFTFIIATAAKTKRQQQQSEEAEWKTIAEGFNAIYAQMDSGIAKP